MVETCCHDTVCPQPLGSQLIHFPAGGDGVAASHHPVVGGRGHNHPDPPHEAADKSSQVQAGGHHLRPLVGTVTGQSPRGSAEPPGEVAAAAAGGWDGQEQVPGRALLQTPGCLCPAPSLGGVRAASSPTAQGRSEGGAPTSARASGASEGEGGCAEEEMHGRTQACLKNEPGGFVQMQNNSPNIRSLAEREKN